MADEKKKIFDDTELEKFKVEMNEYFDHIVDVIRRIDKQHSEDCPLEFGMDPLNPYPNSASERSKAQKQYINDLIFRFHSLIDSFFIKTSSDFLYLPDYKGVQEDFLRISEQNQLLHDSLKESEINANLFHYLITQKFCVPYPSSKPGRPRTISDAKRLAIVELHEKGRSFQWIADKLKLKRSTVYKIYKTEMKNKASGNENGE